ncbi:hypothetical protein DFP94_101163 [Fontibacillus phaseoli]|uniref:Uncharacterized protein n=1 Tax=Fontibacillus phaseoli TaxID=1416533 RepID=A0A369BM06_9BACL|nr:hypothetical protein [Fontibacillus phaseoli]RCX22583.1 hypothetical protein DFP94_101163 [Fontibacillus phaseoli]
MRLAVYCDFVLDGIRPLQLVIQTEHGELDWSEILYLPLSGPFERFEPEQFDDQIGVSVLLEDLVLKRDGDEELGISLPNLARRHPGADITLLVIQISDAEEVLEYKWGDRLMENGWVE